jgi:hypothetical protein
MNNHGSAVAEEVGAAVLPTGVSADAFEHTLSKPVDL